MLFHFFLDQLRFILLLYKLILKMSFKINDFPMSTKSAQRWANFYFILGKHSLGTDTTFAMLAYPPTRNYGVLVHATCPMGIFLPHAVSEGRSSMSLMKPE